MTDTSPAQQAQIFEGLWQVVASHGWRGTTLARIAEAGGVGLGALRGLAASPEGLVTRYNRMVDQHVLDGTVPTDGESPRDRIFDLLMRRLDALQPHRAGITRFTKELPFHPILTLLLGAGMERSMGWMLEAAGISSHGPAGIVRIKGLTAVWIYTLNAWMKDESADLAATMAALDKALDRADQVARSVDRGAKAKPEPVAE
jgi:ubiquinone biosynthesis protein COQ9